MRDFHSYYHYILSPQINERSMILSKDNLFSDKLTGSEAKENVPLLCKVYRMVKINVLI